MSKKSPKDAQEPEALDQKTALELNIEIDPDGRVVFTDLPPDLVDVVLALDPDAVIACSTDNASDGTTDTSSDEEEPV